MPYAYLGLSLFGAMAVLLAYHPIRREPLSVLSFALGWPVGELPLQTIVVQALFTVAFAFLGAFGSWPGKAGLVVAVAEWLGLVGLAIAGERASRTVDAALRNATPSPVSSVPVGTRPMWSSWWHLATIIPLSGRAISVVRNLDYWGDGSRRHRLDVIRPRRGVEGAPVMIYLHGGAWMIGDKREQGKPMMYELVARGWVCVTINYRLSPSATWPDHVVDCKKAIAWTREHIAEYGGDPSFLALSGGSAGGHLSALCALSAGDPAWQPGFEEADTSVDACLPFYGVMDMTGTAAGSGRYGPGLVRLLEKYVMKVKEADHPEVFAQASPTQRVHAGAPPFFVFQGANDTLVPVDVARRFTAELSAVSRSLVAYAELPLAQHAFDVMPSIRTRATTAGVVAFLDAVRADRAAGPEEVGFGGADVEAKPPSRAPSEYPYT